MNRIITFLFILISAFSNAQLNDRIVLSGQPVKEQQNTGLNKEKKENQSTPVIRFRCGATLQSGNEPLYVIDGFPVKSSEVAALNVNDIVRIDVLKDPAGSALFGCMALHGVILITTKQSQHRTFIVKDFLDGKTVAGATVSFISADKKDTLMLISDERGMVVYDRLKHGVEYAIQVTSVGYKMFNSSQTGKGSRYPKEFLLERDEKVCEEVVLTATQCHRICRLSCICKVKGIRPDTLNSAVVYNHTETGYKVYPNPVLKGGTATIELESASAKDFRFQVLSPDGRVMMSQSQKAVKGLNSFSIVMDSRWASGTYIVQIMHDDDKPAAIRKIIVK